MSPLVVTVTWITYTLSLVQCVPSFIENDSIVFPEVDNATAPSDISAKLKECLKDYIFKIEFNGECHSVLTTDKTVCAHGQWLVLDFNSASLPNPVIRGKCAVRRCPPQYHFWVHQLACVHNNQSSLYCPFGSVLDTDYFGDGFCNCIKSPVHVRERNTDLCYPVFKRGPCPQDRVWVKGGCLLDNCTIARARYPQKTILSWSDGKCYAVNERGPCKGATEVLRINPYTARPECEDPKAPLHLVDAPCTGTDHSGKCTKAVSTPQNAFYSQVAEQASKKKTRNVSPK
ncbi:uncharacterized protein LOC128982374 [Macrosteles quadrilineatus]|uniref:uncharacterized protein LOC128982374 n=1 Tax=Macrosteles quadrilineatus TaxID=74068 RepID=UPI0023E30CC0|nr:uncharacterized protein LOC128982374 [Macrosteles quadrilineatus]